MWLDELSARLGREVKLADVPDQEWDALKERGFDIVWLMGIYQRSPEARQIALEPQMTQAYSRALPDWRPDDVIGSPYSVPASRP